MKLLRAKGVANVIQAVWATSELDEAGDPRPSDRKHLCSCLSMPSTSAHSSRPQFHTPYLALLSCTLKYDTTTSINLFTGALLSTNTYYRYQI